MNRILCLLVVATAALIAAGASLVGAAGGVAALEARVDAHFEGQPFELPSRVYTRPLVVRRGDAIVRLDLAGHLARAGYRRVPGPGVAPGEFAVTGGSWRVARRAFRAPSGADPGGLVVLQLDDRGRVSAIHDRRAQVQRQVAFESLLIGTLHGERAEDRRLVRLDEVPHELRDAVLLAEDQRFFEHGGLDAQRILGAFTANLRAGRVVQGGSTITQQLVKNFFLSHERTFSRKLREAFITRVVEGRRSKLEIFEAYLNEVYLGQDGALGVHGVGLAARHYFGKDVGDLALAESALLAGILRGPSLYSPLRNPEGALARRDFVLGRLVEEKRISTEAYAAALASPLALAPRARTLRSAAYFADHLREGLLERYAPEELNRAGLVIHTTLDPRLQALAERAVAEGVARLEEQSPDLRRDGAPLQAALVALEPRSGEILALVGGRDYAISQFNRATAARRQPGSVFKPVVALAALARGERLVPRFTLASTLADEPLAIEAREGEWSPGNHDGRYRGDVTLRHALEQSLNVPLARLGAEVGPRRIVATARRLGFQGPLRSVPSLALGTSETTLLEVTRAYAVLAAEGVRPTLQATRAIFDASGRSLVATAPESVRVFSPAETYLVTSALEGVVNRGTGASLRRLGFRGSAAGKTGTTDDYRDAWFVGYTPELVVGVWVGFDDGASLRQSGSRAALPIFADFLIGAVGPHGGAAFREPPGVERVSVLAEAGYPAGLRCEGEGAAEVFLAGSAPGTDERCRRSWWFARHREARDRARRESTGRRPWVLRIPFGR